MSFIVDKIKWIMIVTGALTCTSIYTAIAPQAALQSTFGETLQGPLAEIVVRHWAIFVTLLGAMLIYGAFNPPVRRLVLTVGAVAKFCFFVLVVSQGGRFFAQQAGIAAVIDGICVILFVAYLAMARSKHAAT